MEDRTPDGTPTVDLGPSEPRGAETTAQHATRSAFDPPGERFEAIGELGRGGMGRVDDAFDRALGRPVAIKHMLSTSEVALGRFEREARITARLEHPGIVPIHDAGRGPDGTPYYVMRRVDGQPLDAKLSDTLAQRLALIPNVLAACDAVAFAHARGIVHRDIKPTNILVGPFGETLVIDWGLAREIGESDDGPAAVVQPSDPQLTVAGTIAGTPGFMAPEQARGESVDARADVFALGATLFFVLSGSLPYDTASATEMVDLAGAGRSPNWGAIPTTVPPELRAIAVKAMASEASERYADAGALAADLRQFITGNLVLAYEYGPLAKFVRFVRRHRGAVAVAAVSAVVVAVIAVLSIRRIVYERDDARDARALAETRQRETASMRDHLLVEHAIELANTNPIAAIATLRTLAPDSDRWREAHAAAAQAFVRGIPFGFEGASGYGYIQIHRDSKLAAVADWRGGQIAIIDLIARTRRTVKTPCDPMIAVIWLGPTHVVCGMRDKIVITDIATNAARTIPIDATYMLGDHDSRVWVMTKSKRVLELDSPTGELREIVRDFDDVDVSPMLDEVMIRRGTKFEVWSGAARIHFELPILEHKNLTSMTIRDHRILVLENYNVHAWRIEDDKLIPIPNIPSRKYIALNIIGNRFYLESADGLSIFEDSRDLGTEPGHGVPFPVPRGVVRIMGDGAFYVIDEDGAFRIEHRSSAIRRADFSIDGRFVVTLGESGETLIWDLAKARPKRIWVDNGSSIVRLTKHYLWTRDMIDGVKRTALDTKQSQVMVPVMATGASLVAENETWAASTHLNDVQVVDVTTGHHLVFDTTMADDDGAGLTFLKSDGTLWRWRPGRDEATKLATLDHVPRFLGAVDDYVTMHFEDETVERKRLSTGAIDRARFPLKSRFGMLDDGTVWVLDPEGAVFRWDLGGPPTKVITGGPIEDLVIDHDRVALYSRRELTLLVGKERYFSPIGSSTFGWVGATTAVTTNVSGEPTVTDLVTGVGYVLPSSAFLGVQRPIGLDNMFAIVTAQTQSHSVVELWNVDVPEDPVALRAWLTTITNAKPGPGNGSYEWP